MGAAEGRVVNEVVSQLREWFESAPDGSTHLIVCVDEMDFTFFPVYVETGEDPRGRVGEEKSKPLQNVKEVYRLDYSFDKQVAEHRCFTYELPLDGYDDHVLEATAALELDIVDTGLLALQVDRVIRAERARRTAKAMAKRQEHIDAEYDARKKVERLDRVMGGITADEISRETETDGEAPEPSLIDATIAREDVDPPGVPPASGASPSTLRAD